MPVHQNSHAYIEIDYDGDVAILRLNRPEKRNALNVPMIKELGAYLRNPPEHVRAAVLHGAGEHFSAGLDLSELTSGSVVNAVMVSRMWHEEFRHIEYGRFPVVVAVHGAVIGGGLELATAGHIRVADTTTYYGLPEGRRGIFVGGGGSVRIARIIGQHRMADLMLTGRVMEAAEGQALGLSTYLEPEGTAFDKALALAKRIAQNASLSNYAIVQTLPRISEAPPETGYFLESLTSAIAFATPEAQEGLRAFLDKRAEKVEPTA